MRALAPVVAESRVRNRARWRRRPASGELCGSRRAGVRACRGHCRRRQHAGGSRGTSRPGLHGAASGPTARMRLARSKAISRRPEKSPSIPPSPRLVVLAVAKGLAAVAGADPSMERKGSGVGGRGGGARVAGVTRTGTKPDVPSPSESGPMPSCYAVQRRASCGPFALSYILTGRHARLPW